MTLSLLLISILLSGVRDIFSKSISDLDFGTKQFFISQSCSFAFGSIILIIITGHNFAPVAGLTNLYSVIYGTLLLITQYCYTMAMKKGNVGICSIVYSLGFIFPTLSGRFLWGEKLTTLDVIGILLVIPTIIISGRPESKKEQSGNSYIVPLLLAMAASGGLGIIQKLQQNSPYPEQKNAFVISAFSLACFVSFVISFFAKKNSQKIGKKLIFAGGIGGAFGVCNLLNTVLAGKLDSAVFFPTLNIGRIILSTAFGFLFYKEKITKKTIIILIMGCTAILLITAT